MGFWRSWNRSNDNGESLGLSPLKFVKYMKKKTYLIVSVERANYTTLQTLSLIQSWLWDKQEMWTFSFFLNNKTTNFETFWLFKNGFYKQLCFRHLQPCFDTLNNCKILKDDTTTFQKVWNPIERPGIVILP